MQYRKKITYAAAALMVFSLILVMAMAVCLPAILEWRLKKGLPHLSELHPIEFSIDKVGLSKASISGIRIGKGLSVDGIHIFYNFSRSGGMEMQKVSVSGLTVQARLESGGRVSIQGMDLPEGESGKSSARQADWIRYLPQKAVVTNSKVILDAEKSRISIPFEIMAAVNTDRRDADIRARIHSFGRPVDCYARLDLTGELKDGVKEVVISAKGFDLSAWMPFISRAAKKNLPDKAASVLPFDFNITSKAPKEQWMIQVSSLAAGTPFHFITDHFNADMLLKEDLLSVKGGFDITDLDTDVDIDSAGRRIPVEYSAKIRLKEDFPFQARVSTGKMESFTLQSASNRMDIKNPELSLAFSGTRQTVKGVLNAGGKRIRFNSPDPSGDRVAIFQNSRAKVNFHADIDGTKNRVGSTFQINTAAFKVAAGDFKAAFPELLLNGAVTPDKKGNPIVRTMLAISKGRFTSPKHRLEVLGISARIPFTYPYAGETAQGRYEISQVRYGGREMVSCKGTMTQENSRKISVQGRLTGKIIQGVVPEFKGVLGMDKGFYANLDWKHALINMTEADVESLLPPDAEELFFDLSWSAEGQAEYKNHKLTSSLQVNVSDGNLQIPGSKIYADGIRTAFEMRDLVSARSKPGQTLTVDSVKIDKVKIKDARLRFTIEDASSLLIENIRFRWCNGLVSSEAIRFSPKTGSYGLSLYCDRLELVKLLEQIGAFDAHGSGTLNGRIPIHYKDGEITFDNGFLFSTPGSGGKIVIENAEALTAGIPLDSPQFAELDVAREALKDFDYKWAKLVFNSFEDTLFVNMELDGKPSGILPFEYKKEIGRFVRVGASSPGSNFQGIKLNVNLNLPFNDVMKFGNKLKSNLQ